MQKGVYKTNQIQKIQQKHTKRQNKIHVLQNVKQGNIISNIIHKTTNSKMRKTDFRLLLDRKKEKFEDAKRVIRSRKSKDRQNHEKEKTTNNNLLSTTQKTVD